MNKQEERALRKQVVKSLQAQGVEVNPIKTGKGTHRECIKILGGVCACCGYSDIRFLEIDHINNDGKEDRKKRTFTDMLKEIIFFPEKCKKTLQVLCSNCNQGKRKNKGVCPHKIVNSAGEC